MDHPLWQHDRKWAKASPTGLVGLDEVGRGALAGPVVASAVWIGADFFKKRSLYKATQAINDSKALSPELREHIFELATTWADEGLLRYAVAEASVEEIESFNILGATTLAMKRALLTLKVPVAQDTENLPLFPSAINEPCHTAPAIVIDGRPLKAFDWPHTAIVKGDSQSLAIALASILAKVSRDRLMTTLATRYPAYGLENHKGYGTPEHQAAIEKVGPTAIHRLSFLKDPENHRTLELVF